MVRLTVKEGELKNPSSLDTHWGLDLNLIEVSSDFFFGHTMQHVGS